MALCLLFLEDKCEKDKRNVRDGRRHGMGQGGKGKGKKEIRDLCTVCAFDMFYALTLHKGCLCTTVGLQYKTFHSVNRNFISIQCR